MNSLWVVLCVVDILKKGKKMKVIKIHCCGDCPYHLMNEGGKSKCELGAKHDNENALFFDDCPFDDAEQTVDSISLENAVEIPVWRMVGITEPERLIDVRMDYKTLTAICNLIISRKEKMK